MTRFFKSEGAGFFLGEAVKSDFLLGAGFLVRAVPTEGTVFGSVELRRSMGSCEEDCLLRPRVIMVSVLLMTLESAPRWAPVFTNVH